MPPVHFGALVPQGWKREFDGLDARTAYRTMIEAAQRTEALGYDSIWLYDTSTPSRRRRSRRRCSSAGRR